MLTLVLAAALPTLSGGWLLALCNSADKTERGMCTAFVAGFNAGAALTGPRPYCAPDLTSAERYRVVIVEHLRERPEAQRLEAGAAALAALRSEYPCK